MTSIEADYIESIEFDQEIEEEGIQVNMGTMQKVNTAEDHFPCSIVWSPIPVLTWLLPFVGHLGITTSKGIINDFAGSRFINVDSKSTGFGKVTKYMQIDLKDISDRSIASSRRNTGNFNKNDGYISNNHPTPLHQSMDLENSSFEEMNFAAALQAWDDAVEGASSSYRRQEHNLITNNCHAHVATALNRLNYKGIKSWNTVLLIFYMMVYGKFVSPSRFIATYLPFSILCVIIVTLVLLIKFA